MLKIISDNQTNESDSSHILKKPTNQGMIHNDA